MKTNLLIWTAIFFSSVAYAQTWNKTITHGQRENLGVIVQSDSTFYTLNKSNRYVNGVATVMKFDNNGSRLFEREFAQSTASSTTNNPKDIAGLLNGNYVYCGAAGGAGVDWLVRRQNNTNALWTRRFNYSGYSGGIAEAVVAGIDSTIVTVGSFNDSATYRPAICNLDYSGNTEWIAAIEGVTSFQVVDVIQASDSGYIMLGTSSDFSQGGNDIFAVKFNKNGGLDWAKNWGGTDEETAGGLTLDENGDLYIVGSTRSYGMDAQNDIIVIKMDQNGNLIQTKVFENSVDAINGYNIIKMANGVAISYVEFSSEQQIGIMHLDASLDIQWNYLYGHVSRAEGRPKMAYVPYDSGFVVNAQAYDNFKSMFLRGDKYGFVSDCNMFDGKTVSENIITVGNNDITSSIQHKYIPLTASGGTGIGYTENRNITNHHFVVDTIITDISCTGLTDGEISSTVTLGTGTITHEWSTGQQDVGNITSTISGLSAGIYTYEVSDQNNCTHRTSMTVEEPLPLVVNVSGDDSPCFGQALGSVWVTASQGTAPYNYLWTSGATTDTVHNLSSGSYSVTVTDDRGCLGAGSYTVNQASELAAAINSSNAVCVGDSSGTASITVSGGTGPFSYLWNNGNVTSTVINLPAQMYYVTLQDSCGATLQDSIEIMEPLPMSGVVSTTPVDCNGGADGSAIAIINNGTMPYNYIWSNSSSTINSASNLSASNPIDSVLVIDACDDTSAFVFTISQPDLLTATVVTQDASCHNTGNGMAFANVQGGTLPYSYLWNIIQTTDTINNLFPATYTVNITDANGCFTTNSGTVGSPTPVSVQFLTTNPTCYQNNGEIIANPLGGVSPYSYAWSNGDTDSIANNLSAGYYSLTVIDGNGCMSTYDSSLIGELQTTVNPVNLCLVSVDTATGRNLLVWAQPTGAAIAGYNIYRNVAGAYSLQAYWPGDSLSQWIDYSFGVDPTITSYRYKISAVDSCGNESVLSDFHETIHLTTNTGTNNTFNLVWDDYEGFNFTHYRILWDSLNDGNWQVLDSVPSTNFTYSHTTLATNPAYSIEVIAPNTCTSSRANHNTTRSNRTQPISNGGSTNSIVEYDVNDLNLFPNPNQGDFNLVFSSHNSGVANTRIFDSYGRLIQINQHTVYEGKNHIHIALQNMSSGFYFLELRKGDFNQKLRFFVR